MTNQLKILPFLIVITHFLFGLNGYCQRSYKSKSVFASGIWYKIAAPKEGIYKIDEPFLKSCGINTNFIKPNEIKIFGNNAQMLPEANNDIFVDDVIEIPIEMHDGADGIFNNKDYFIFYAQSADKWINDSLNNRFIHQKHLYSTNVFYFINISAGNGKRIAAKTILNLPTQIVDTYDDRYFYESELVNFLSSGKQWFGEELSATNGNNLTKNFLVDWQNGIPNSPITLKTNLIARSIGAAANISVYANNQLTQNHLAPAVQGGYLDVFANPTYQISTFTANNSPLNIAFNYTNAIAGGQVWLDFFELNGRRQLFFENSKYFTLRDWKSVGINNYVQFNIDSATNTSSVWEITNLLEPFKIRTIIKGNVLSFVNDASVLREYIAFNESSYLLPIYINNFINKNLHNIYNEDFIIISNKLFLSQANALASFHQSYYSQNVIVVTDEDVYNEFAAGIADPTAIKNFIKMLYDRRQGSNFKLKNILLFGSSSFDYKNKLTNNTNYVSGYESANSLDPLNTYTTDDYFGFLEDTDDINNETNPPKLDIAIGRIAARSIAEATTMVDKIINYHQQPSLGNWRSNITFIADDKDQNLHLNDAEIMAGISKNSDSILNINKIYLDAFKAQNNNSGITYPDANAAIVNRINAGNLICNYTGHGGSQRLAEEGVLTTQEINQLNNNNRLPLFVTATCDFDAFDDPNSTSLGHHLLFDNSNGAIALMATTRVVFSSSNKIINTNYLNNAFNRDSLGQFLTLGETILQTKNATNQTLGDIINNRKFALLGDPAMKLALPQNNINIKLINGYNTSNYDTLKPLEKYTLSGVITNFKGIVLNNFAGTIYPTIYNQPQLVKTLGNSPESPVTSFETQNNILFKGKASVIDGKFDFSFMIPKDVGVSIGKAKISLYADDEKVNAAGANNHFFVGGFANNNAIDNLPPTVNVHLNDEKFINGGLVNETPILLIKMFDSSGINTSGLGIGHNINLIIDGKENNTIVLNTHYEALLNSYKSGKIKFQLPTLNAGKHFLTIKVWDIANNSTTVSLDFEVINVAELAIKNLFNYPNPFTTSTVFMFEHNQPSENLSVQINIYSVTGKLVHQINRLINTAGNLCNDIFWDGKDKNNEKLARGVYIYTIIANSKNGSTRKTQKLYLL